MSGCFLPHCVSRLSRHCTLYWIDYTKEKIAESTCHVGLTVREAMDLADVRGDHPFVPVAAKCLASGACDDDELL